jgi:inosine/xanthosine triphosphate pyrophosphatase family protein
MFAPEGLDRTFAEMSPAAKQQLSHRARALRQLVRMCFAPR